MRLLVNARKQNVERLNLREVVLLILRTLIVLLLVLAASRPLVRGFWGNAIADHEPTGVVMVLDGTMSMKYRSEGESMFERSIERIRSILKLMRDDDRVRILLSDREVSGIGKGEKLTPHEAGRYLEGLAATNYGGRLNDSLRRAVEMARKMELPWKEVYVFTDLQPASIDSRLFARENEQIPIIFFTETDSGAVNRFLDTIDLTMSRESGEDRWFLSVGVGSSGGDGKPGIFPRLYLDDEMAGIVEVRLTGEGRKTARFPLDVRPGPHRRVRVEIEPDGLALDDVRYFLTGRERVLDIERGKGIDSVKPVRIALDLLEKEMVTATNFEVDPQLAEPVRVALWSDSGTIQEAVDKSIGLVVFPDPAQVSAPGKGPLPVSSTGPVVLSEKSYKQIALPIGNRLPAFIEELTEGLRRIRVMRFNRLRLEEGWLDEQNLWRLDLEGGEPFLVGGEMGGMRVVVWSIPPTEDSSDLFTSPLFLPLLDGVIRYAAGGEDIRNYICGDPANIKLTNVNPGTPLTIGLPGGAQVIGRVGPGGEFSFDETGEPGFYNVTAWNLQQEGFAVNVDTRESDFTEIGQEELARRLSPMPIRVVRKGAGLVDSILTRRGRREVTAWLVLAAFFILLAESQISGRIQGT